MNGSNNSSPDIAELTLMMSEQLDKIDQLKQENKQLRMQITQHEFDNSTLLNELQIKSDKIVSLNQELKQMEKTERRNISNSRNLKNKYSGYCNTGNFNSGERNTGGWNIGDRNTGCRNSGNRNTGDNNTGDCNSGYCNMGNRNTGDKNSGGGNSGNYNWGYRNPGNYNQGDYNSGKWNSGYCNTGDYNSGDRNSGCCNTGYGNTGDYNSGDCNSGHYNMGYLNTGIRNIGSWNTGDWNAGNCHSGIFNTEKNPKIKMFDNESDWTIDDWRNSSAKEIMDTCPYTYSDFINETDMTDKEKENYPEYKTIGGYVKIFEASQKDKEEWWNTLLESEKDIIKALPNFNYDKFRKCIGF